MARLRVAALCFVSLVILIGFPGRSLSASAPADLVESAARVETASISVGDRALNAAPRHRACDPHTGWTIDRGAVVERLLPRAKGLEQTWTFAERPAGDGDLVVRVAATGAEFVGPDARGLTFRDLRTGAVWTYGHGTWIDAGGRRTAVPARWAGGAIELRVPAAVVHTSTYPAVLDPVVSEAFELGEPITGLPAVGDQSLTDVWWNGTNWSVRWESGNEDIAARVSPDGTLLDEYGVDVEGRGASATDGTNRLYVRRSLSGVIAFTLVDPQDQVIRAETIPYNTGTNPDDFAIAYGNGVYLVTWVINVHITDYLIRGRRIGADGVLLDSQDIFISDNSDDLRAVQPSLAFGGGLFFVAWTRYEYIWRPVGTYHGPHEVRATRIAADGSDLDPVNILVDRDDVRSKNPQVAYVDGVFLTVWETANGTDSDISGRRADVQGTLLDPTSLVVSDAIDAQYDIDVGTMEDEFFVIWTDGRDNADQGDDIFGTRITADGIVTDSQGIAIGAAAGDQQSPTLISSDSEYFVVWNDGRTVDATGTDVYGARVSSSGIVLDPGGIAITQAMGEQSDPMLSWNGSTYLVAWQDGRNWSTDIYSRLVSQAGTLDVDEILVTRSVNGMKEPTASNGDGTWLVAWLDERDADGPQIYVRQVDSSCAASRAGEQRLSMNSISPQRPKAAFGNGQWLIAWQDKDSRVINGARYNPEEGAVDAIEFPISLDDLYSPERPNTCGGDSGWLVVWASYDADFIGGDYTAKARLVNPDGTLAGSLIEFPPLTAGWYSMEVACIQSATGWLVLWSEKGPTSSRIVVGQEIDGTGEFLGEATVIAEGTRDTLVEVAFDGTNFFVTNPYSQIKGKLFPTIGAGEAIDVLVASDSQYEHATTDYDGAVFTISWTSGGKLNATWVTAAGVSLDTVGSTILDSVDVELDAEIRSNGVNADLAVYAENDPFYRASRVRFKLVDHTLVAASADAQPDGNVDVAWQVNPVITDAQSVNVYRSLAFDEGFEKVNTTPLPLDSATVDLETRPGLSNFYSIELVRSGGETVRDARDKLWAMPPAPERTFLLSVRETTVASVPGDTSTYDVEVQSQKGYDGAVALDVIGLPPEAVSATFDPATVDVPGHSTLTVQWDPLIAPPAGGYSYPFQISATEVGSASAVIKTVNVLGVVVGDDDRYLTQFVYPAEPEAGHEAEVFGRLTPHEAGQVVTVTTGTTADVYTAATDETGYFSLAVPVAAAGTIQFSTAAAGTSAAPYVTAAKRGRRQARMTARTADGVFDPGDLVEVDGEIEPSAGVGTVHLEIENPDETTAFSGNVSVDEYGTFHQSFFAQEGVTSVEVEVGDNADFYNTTARLNVPVNAPIGMAIVVAAGGETGNPDWPVTGTLCDAAYTTYRGRLIPENRIRYLHSDMSRDPDGDGEPEVSATPTRANVQAAIETWASGLVDVSTTAAPFRTPLTLYIAGLEDSPGVIRLNETETLSSTELDAWLDQFLANVQARYTDDEVPAPTSVPINIVLEFRRSGVFLADLSAPNRIIVTSTGDHGIVYPPASNPPYPGEVNWIDEDGSMSFSSAFYGKIRSGYYIASAWAEGWAQMVVQTQWDQVPLLDANGNGVPNEDADRIQGDGAGDKVLEYRDTYKKRPVIDLTFSGLTIPAGRADGLLWAKMADNDFSIVDRVKCVIIPPTGSGESIREYRMPKNEVSGRYELRHDGFRHKGLYKILITAVDEDEDAALPWVSLVDVRGDTVGEDTTPPEDVTDVYTQARDGSVYLSWTESISSDVAGYYVYTKPAGGSYGTGVYAGNTDHFTVTGLTNGASYQFKITAIDEVPNESAGTESGLVTPRGAQFAAAATEVLPNTPVQFADLSTGSPIGWSWDLNGDTVVDSTAQHPSYLYTTLGTYTVTLTATYADGSDTETKTDYISVQSQVADFSATPTHGTLPMGVQFTDESIIESAITAWSWDLDGDSVEDATDEHPSFQYDAPGEYDVTLTVTTAGGSDSETKTGYIVVACPTPDTTFTSDVTSGPAPLDVTFTSTTTAPATGCDPTSWDWTFGDTGTGTGEIVGHTYTEDGSYDVCLTVTVPGTSAQTCVVDYVDVGGGCASGNLCLTLLLAGYWDGTEQSTEAYLTIDFYADPEAAPSYRITNVQLDVDGTAVVDLTAAGVLPGAYYVVARPLNHLDLMSEGALTVGGLTAAGLDADFTDPAQVACGEAALVFVGERWCAPGGDASGDGQVDLSDYSLLAQQWGLAGPEADFTGDAVVDLSDYSNLAQYWTQQMCVDVPLDSPSFPD